jgi:hypothetical protein
MGTAQERADRLRRQLAEAQRQAAKEKAETTHLEVVRFASAIEEKLGAEELTVHIRTSASVPADHAPLGFHDETVARTIGRPYSPAEDVSVPGPEFAGAFWAVRSAGELPILEALYDVQFYRGTRREGVEFLFGPGPGWERVYARLIMAWNLEEDES